MPTTAERHALTFIAAVAILGGSVRAWQSRTTGDGVVTRADSSTTAEGVRDQLRAIDGARRAKGGSRGGKAAKPAAPVDIDVASSADIERLPRVGPALAARIVANRDSFGPFGNLEELGHVRGVGEAMRRALAPLVTFSGPESGSRAAARDAVRQAAVAQREARDEARAETRAQAYVDARERARARVREKVREKTRGSAPYNARDNARDNVRPTAPRRRAKHTVW